MRQLTFKGFLGAYAQDLASRRTRSLSRLLAEVQREPRLMEPLLLWAVVREDGDRMRHLLADQPTLQAELASLASLHDRGRLERALEKGGHALRPEYAKVWTSYVARRDAHDRDEDLKSDARKQVLVLERSKGVTRYQMAKDLGLNPGNLHAFLAQGNMRKLSLDRANGLVRYLRAV